MNSIPLVSVVIPVYNGSEFISETISSVLSQEFTDYEIIVVDDGSTDNSAEIIASFSEKVRYFKKANGGQASARNTGILNALGKYIAFLDADDLWVMEKLKIEVEVLESSKAKWIYSDAFAFSGDIGNILYKFSNNLTQYEGDILESLIISCFIPSPTPIVEKGVFKVTGLFNEDPKMRNREDWDMWLRIAARYPVKLVSQPLAYYRVHSSSATGSEKRFSSVNGYLLTIEEAVKREPIRLGPLRNKVLSKLYFGEARSLASINHSKEARKMLINSMKFRPFRLILYIYWAVIPFVPYIRIRRNKLSMKFLRILFHSILGE